jgi:hypothetical protein
MEAYELIRHKSLNAPRATLTTMLGGGSISGPVYEELITEVSMKIARPAQHQITEDEELKTV